MKYKIGQEVFAIAFIKHTGDEVDLAPLVWDEEQPSKIFIKKLKVVSHHQEIFLDVTKQPVEFVGYFLEDNEKNIWEFQHPISSTNRFHHQPKEGENIKNLVSNQVNFPLQMEELDEFMGSLFRTIEFFKGKRATSHRVKPLEKFRDSIIFQFAKDFPDMEIKEVFQPLSQSLWIKAEIVKKES